LIWALAGLTCTADNCSEKGGFFNHAAKAGIAMVLPDTSPRTPAIVRSVR
jgi:S-formylglutathione hydrolase